MHVLRIKAWHQDGGSADDRRGRTMLLVRIQPIRIGQKSVRRCHAIHHVGTQRMSRNHELKYLALYPRQSPVDPCVIRSPSDISITCSVYPAVSSSSSSSTQCRNVHNWNCQVEEEEEEAFAKVDIKNSHWVWLQLCHLCSFCKLYKAVDDWDLLDSLHD